MENKTSTRRYLKLTAAAEYLGYSPWKVRKLIAEGKLPYVQDGEGGPFRIDIHDLDEFMGKNKITRTA